MFNRKSSDTEENKVKYEIKVEWQKITIISL